MFNISVEARHDPDRMVVGFTTTCAISPSPLTANVPSSNPAHGKLRLFIHFEMATILLFHSVDYL